MALLADISSSQLSRARRAIAAECERLNLILPDEHTFRRIYQPLLAWGVAPCTTKPVLGLGGAQGTGKSTIARLLLQGFSALGKRAALLSLDDLYLTRQERRQLSLEVHPLLQTRGVPGTHDVRLGVRIIDSTLNLTSGTSLLLPRFDKAVDDRAKHWASIDGPVDIMVFEGWCLGASASPESELSTPLNRFEANEDADGRFRNYINAHLRDDYPALFNKVTQLLFLQAPGFEQVCSWRKAQEERLPMTAPHRMDTKRLYRFQMHFERITREQIRHPPGGALVVPLTQTRHPIA